MGGNSGARTWELLRQEARAARADVQALATNYVIERMMARLMAADARGAITIKGGQSLSLLLGPMRPTKDLDLNVSVTSTADPEVRTRIVATIAAACSAGADDGVAFDVEGMEVEHREHQGEGGLRITVPASIHTSRIPFVIDIGIGNEMTFAPTAMTVPGVLGGRKSAPPPVEAKVYPMETTIAEKLVAKFEDGSASIRHKDFFDIWMLIEIARRVGDLSLMSARRESLDGETADLVAEVRDHLGKGTLLSLPPREIAAGCVERLALSLRRTADQRGAEIPDDVEAFLMTEFAGDPVQSAQWPNWCRNNAARLRYVPPGMEKGADRNVALAVLLADVAPFLEQVASRAREMAPGMCP